MESKACTQCKQVKPLDLFYDHIRGRKQSWCKQCQLDKLNEYWRSPQGVSYRKQYYSENKEMYANAAKKWVKNNRKKANQFVYSWAKNNTEQYVGIQDKYQSRIPPSVYCIKYDDEVIYVGKARKPQARVNVHLSTIKSGTNLTKVNKLHSYCGFDKSRFSYEYLEQGEYDTLLGIERQYEAMFDAKGNYKRLFGDVKTIGQIQMEVMGKTTYEKYYK